MAVRRLKGLYLKSEGKYLEDYRRRYPAHESWVRSWQRLSGSPARYAAAFPRRRAPAPAAPPGRAYQRDTQRTGTAGLAEDIF